MTNKSILITPEQTLIKGKPFAPDSINIVLENGHSYNLDTLLDLLEKHDKKRGKKTPFFSRVKRALHAFSKTLAETDSATSPK